VGLGVWEWAPTPNPQSPIPNPQSPIPIFNFDFKNKMNKKINYNKIKLIV
jgi:hypothetical protein